MTHNVETRMVALRATRKTLFEASQQRLKLVKNKNAGVPVAQTQFDLANAQIAAARDQVLDARNNVRLALLEV